MKTNLNKYINKTKDLIGKRVYGIDRESGVPEEGGMVTETIDPSTVRLDYVYGTGGIGLRGLDELYIPEEEIQL